MRRSVPIQTSKNVPAGLALFAVIAVGCGDPGTGPGDGFRIEGPSSIRLTAVGESVRLNVSSTDSRPVLWRTSAPGVAEVDRDGNVSAVGAGAALVSAQLQGGVGRDSVLVTVDLEAVALQFVGPLEHAVRGAPFFRTVRLAVIDAGGTPIAGDTRSVSVALVGGAAGLDGTTARPAVAGIATFEDLSISVAQAGMRITATTAGGLQATSNAFDVVASADHIVVRNATAAPLGLLIDGEAASGFVNDAGRVVPDSTVDLLMGEGAGEVIAFMRGRPPVVAPAAWTAAPDTVQLTLPAAIAIPVTVWVVKGPYAEQQARAASAIATTTLIWDDERMGLSFSNVEFVDATADPDAPAFHDLVLCNQQSQMIANIGKRTGRINIYYVGTVDGGTDRGRACGGADFTMMAERSGHELLAHEIGHLFGLGHVDTDPAFDRTNVMHSASSTRRYLTEGQVFRSHYNAFGALRATYDRRTDAARNCADGASDRDCPALDRRLFDDGGFPADPLSTVTAWLTRTCAVGAIGEEALLTVAPDADAALLDALDREPVLMDDIGTEAARRVAGIRARIAAGETFGLDDEVLAALQASLGSAPARARADFLAGYREAAVRGLGVLGGRRALERLGVIAADAASPLAPAARRALAR